MAKGAGFGVMTVGNKGRVTLSDEIRKNLGISEGDVLVPELTDHGTVELVPMALIPKDQVWFAHPEMQARIAAARADITAGRTTAVRTPDDLSAYFARLDAEGRDD